jgi:hypothetical protein
MDISLCIEPWGDVIFIGAGAKVSVVASGPTGDCLHVEVGQGNISIYGWPGSSLSVFSGENLIREFPNPVPTTPSKI